MPIVGIRKTAFYGLSAGRKAAFRYVAHKVGVVSPVENTSPPGITDGWTPVEVV